ncbi:MAG: hypothetical protein J5697_01095 [Clostridia bacterium]|nr:hypothetical protein [Clostridia bacterium]
MKKTVKRGFKIFSVIFLLFAFASVPYFSACAPNEYILNEKTFFKVMTNIQYYPEQYLGKNVEFDCFTYSLTDVESGAEYVCGVRKCSSGYGCTCGRDTVIGFILKYDGDIPAPTNQSEDSADKTWVHIKGRLSGAEKTKVSVYAYENGEITGRKEEITFLSFDVSSISLIEDYSGLNYFVTK